MPLKCANGRSLSRKAGEVASVAKPVRANRQARSNTVEENANYVHFEKASIPPNVPGGRKRDTGFTAPGFDGSGVDGAKQNGGKSQHAAWLRVCAARRDHGSMDAQNGGREL